MPGVLATSLNELAHKPLVDEKERKEVYDAALRLAWSVESQQDTAQRLYHGHLPLSTAQVGIDLKLFEYLSENADKAFSIDQLAAKTGAEPALLARLLGFYAAQRMVLQTPQGTFTASNITHNLSIPGTAAGIKHYSLTMTQCYNAIPEFLSRNQYSNPTDSAPFNLAYNTDMRVFEWRKHNPKNAEAGQAFMAAQRMGQRSVWDGQTTLKEFEMSPLEVKQDRVMVCDVGGGLGHQCVDLRKYRPDLQGKIVTEDLPLVHNMIANREEMEALNIHPLNHNFMDEQPIKGAKVYYLRNVIHNWSDEGSTTILSQISKAMAPDSVLILDEVVMPLLGVSWKQASMDLAMMTMLAAKERTESDFVKLLASAGLQMREIRTYDEDYGDSLIIAEPLPTNGEKVDQPLTNGHSNGVETNGVHSNGVETNGVHAPDVETNGVQADVVVSNGVHHNDTEKGAAQYDAIQSNGVVSNTIELNGSSSNDVETNAVQTNGA